MLLQFAGMLVWPYVATVLYALAWIAAIGVFYAIARVTISYLGAGWLLLTMPAVILLGFPLLKRMARLSGETIH